MEKVNVVLVVLKREALENVIANLNFDNANLVAIITDPLPKEKNFQVGEQQIPLASFAQIQQRIKKHKDSLWLIGSYLTDLDDLCKLKKFLTTNGLPEDKIVNFEVSSQVSPTWLANLRHVEKNGADFFATGNEYMRDGLNLKYIPRVYTDEKKCLGGANLSDANQDLQQSYLTAKHIFEHVERGTIKFVLIGLTPESFLFDNVKDSFDFEYLLSLATTPEQANLNFDDIKKSLDRDFSARAIADWNDDTTFLTPNAIEKYSFQFATTAEQTGFSMDSIADWDDNAKPLIINIDNKNVQLLKDYIQLCLDNNAKPIGVVFPFAPAMRKIYREEILNSFRETIRQLEESYDFTCIDMFSFNLDYDCFCDITHLNLRGMKYVNSLLSFRLCNLNLIPAESFCDMTYEYLYALSNVAPKEEYNAFMERVFNVSAQRIRRKDKIKIAFVVRGASEWCGDDLYNLFADDKRFETTVFDCLQMARVKNELFKKDCLNGVEQLKSRGLNVVALDNRNAKVPAQDVFIFLTPYFHMLPNALNAENITAKTLLTYITYSFAIAVRSKGFHNRNIFHICWKAFFASLIALNDYQKFSTVGMPRGLFSGYPRIDIFFKKDTSFHFDWKMARPNAKKIIWAPHWSINGGVKYATFQWNYKFMYEFAKAHPEISWIIKPHPNLLYSAIDAKVFSSTEAFEKYLQKWNELPNAMVYTGAYYQAIFATSDGMIQDCSSFIAEYQFVDKPMIYLTRAGEKFNNLGNAILKVSYLVDGKDFEGIAALIQNVFIEGKDNKAAARKEVFDKYLNYPKYNGMLASEFIYKNIADELKGES